MRLPFLTVIIRRQLHGEDDLSVANNHHILHLGPGRAARVRKHASIRLQRRRCHPIHVRSLLKVNTQLGQEVVSPGTGIQQGASTFPIFCTVRQTKSSVDRDPLSHRHQV